MCKIKNDRVAWFVPAVWFMTDEDEEVLMLFTVT